MSEFLNALEGVSHSLPNEDMIREDKELEAYLDDMPKAQWDTPVSDGYDEKANAQGKATEGDVVIRTFG